MRGILRLGLMMLLVAAAGVGNVWGKEGTSGNWQYETIGKTTCRIWLLMSKRSSISGTVTVPSEVEDGSDRFTVVEIGRYAFSGCSKLDTVIIPNSVTTIGRYAFNGCSGLKAVDIPNSVTVIWQYAFISCKELKEVTIPSSAKTIGDGAFSYCNQLTEFKVDEENASYSEVDGVLFTKSRQILIAYPGGREGAFKIPYGVTRIDSSAFSGCDGLTEVEIPSFVGWIGPYAFADCTSLDTVYIYQPDYLEVEETAFEGIAKSATLYVRLGMKEKIKDKPWCNGKFTNVVGGYVVTFQDGEGNKLGEQLVKPNNGTATAPKAPTKEGYTFAGWQLDGKKYDFGKKVEKNITLVAKWKKKEESTPSTPKDPKTAVESVQLAGVRVVRNPVGEALELEGMERAARVEVYSVVGARVHAEALRGEPRVVIDAHGWASGVYVVRVVASDGAKTLRVVK